MHKRLYIHTPSHVHSSHQYPCIASILARDSCDLICGVFAGVVDFALLS
jgi:hypothetical protein